jgi:hypothetical protein
VYFETDYDPDGNAFGEPREDTLAVVADTLIDSELWYCVTSSLDQTHRHYTIRPEGVFVKFGTDAFLPPGNPPELYFPYCPTGEYRQVLASSAVLSTDGSIEDITTNIREYSCLVYTLRAIIGMPSWQVRTYVAPGVGVVLWRKFRVSEVGSRLVTTAELVSHTVR